MLNTGTSRHSRPPKGSASRIRHALYAALTFGAVVLGGCDFFGPNTPGPTILKPTTLNPESDAFLQADTRTYTWVEALRRSGKSDSVYSLTTFDVTRTGDTVLGGSQRPYLDVSENFNSVSVAPAALFARLGFRSDRIHFDTALIADPGPAYRFPDTPSASWRLDTIVGDTRFVRRLKGTAVLAQSGQRIETWAFAESTWWNQGTPVLISTGTTWMGAAGLVRHESLWTGFVSFTGETGSVFRSIIAD